MSDLRKDQALFRIAGLQAAAKRFRSVATSVPSIEPLCALLQRAFDLLAAIVEQDGDDEDTLREALRDMDTIGSLLECVEASGEVPVPAIVVRSFSALGELATNNPEFRLCVWAIWEPKSYRINCDLLRKMSQTVARLEKMAGVSSPPVNVPETAVSSIPAAEAADVLQHVVLAHEIGHELYQLYKPVLPVQGMFHGQLSTEEAWLPQSAQKWMQELYCDLVACALMGPSFPAAMAFKIGLQGAGDSHPPSWLRLQHCTGFLKGQRDQRQFAWAVDEIIAEVESALDWHKTAQPFDSNGQSLQQRFEAAFSEHAGLLSQAIVETGLPERVRAIPMASLQTRSEVQNHPLVDALLRYVPPCYDRYPALGEGEALVQGIPADLPSVLLAGWTVRTRFWDGGFRASFGDSASAEDALNRLLAKGLEAAYVVKQLGSTAGGR